LIFLLLLHMFSSELPPSHLCPPPQKNNVRASNVWAGLGGAWPGRVGRGGMVQFAGIDSTTKVTGPVENNNPMYALFYLGAIVVAGYLVINIFVGVFVDSYNVAAEKMGRDEIAKPEPRAKLAPLDEEDDDGMRATVVEVVTNTNFDLFIAFFIVTNVVTMAFESFKQVHFPYHFPEFLPVCCARDLHSSAFSSLAGILLISVLKLQP
jgi:hypothetical protein